MTFRRIMYDKKNIIALSEELFGKLFVPIFCTDRQNSAVFVQQIYIFILIFARYRQKSLYSKNKKTKHIWDLTNL